MTKGCSFEWLASSKLPSLDPVHWIYQHQNIQQQAVADPDQQGQLNQNEEGERFPPTEFRGNCKSDRTRKDVADRVHYRVTEIIERGRIFPILFDYIARVFQHLPRRLTDDGGNKPPAHVKPFQQDTCEPESQHSMQDVGKRVRVEQMLRRMAAIPCLVNVNCQVARLAPPDPALRP